MKYQVTYTKTIHVTSEKKLSTQEVEEIARNLMYRYYDFTERHMEHLNPQVLARLGDYTTQDLTATPLIK